MWTEQNPKTNVQHFCPPFATTNLSNIAEFIDPSVQCVYKWLELTI